MKKRILLIGLLIMVSCALFIACETNDKTPYEKPSNPVLSATADSINVTQPSDNDQYSYEYSQNNEDWQEGRVFSSLQPNTEYTIYMRRKENTRYLASPSSSSKITTLKYENTAILQNIEYTQNEKTIEIISDDVTLEFSFDGTTYSDTKTHTYTENGEKTIFARFKTTNSHLASTPYEKKVFISNFAYGRGTDEEPFVIKTKEQLKITDTRYEDYFYYRLENDLDFENETIQNNLGNIYGELDGNGHIIKNAVISYDGHNDSRSVGLFGIIDDVKDLILENVNITGEAAIDNVPAGVNFGLLAGIVSQTATNCKTTGRIELDLEGDTQSVYAGGLCGASNDSIINCSSEIEIDIVTKNSEIQSIYAGGLAGRAANILKSFASGSIEVEASERTFNIYAGGLTGRLNNTVENCYTLVYITVDAKDTVTVTIGGIAGDNGLNSSPTIKNSYSASNIGVLCSDRNTYVGGIIGRLTIDGAIIENSFFVGNIANSTSGTNPFNEVPFASSTSDIIGYYKAVNSGQAYAYEITNCYRNSSSDFQGSNVEYLGNAVNENMFEDQIWLEGNLDWDTDIWLFKSDSYPILK